MRRYIIAAAALAAVPGVAYAKDKAADFTGPRIEARLGYETPTVSDDTGVYKIGSAVSYGGEAGFDLGKKVTFGGYVTWEASGVKFCDNGSCLGEDSTLGAGARVGFVVSKNLLLFVKGGWSKINMSASQGGQSGTASKDGVQGAIGIETNLSKMTYTKLEFNYGDYGDFFGAKLQRRQAAVGFGVRF
jgi:outer membrane immunogenic protein